MCVIDQFKIALMLNDTERKKLPPVFWVPSSLETVLFYSLAMFQHQCFELNEKSVDNSKVSYLHRNYGNIHF